MITYTLAGGPSSTPPHKDNRTPPCTGRRCADTPRCVPRRRGRTDSAPTGAPSRARAAPRPPCSTRTSPQGAPRACTHRTSPCCIPCTEAPLRLHTRLGGTPSSAGCCSTPGPSCGTRRPSADSGWRGPGPGASPQRRRARVLRGGSTAEGRATRLSSPSRTVRGGSRRQEGVRTRRRRRGRRQCG